MRGPERPVRRLLVANRGEIVARIARSAHRLGIGTVGVYSEPDADALHVDAVDVAVALGGATPTESYLRGDAIIEAALRTGADAVHPGYGFLAENAAFARDVIDAGLVWVGPSPDQIALLGDKLAAKRAAVAAGVPTSPMIEIEAGDDGAVTVPTTGEVTFPALVKAAAGGGGRGMRVVRQEAELAEAIASAAREAASAFGDSTVFIEPFFEHARHVEVQIVGDRHGTVLHFGERECSIQRRNQKVVEEAPSPGITQSTRQQLHDGALALAKHVGYENAGTVEFLVDDEGSIQFLEVNTRLQVEHPVSEAITGVDLVELQLRVASGESLPVTQDDITMSGHAIEVRLVAEDPAAGWLPSTGPIHRFHLPTPPQREGPSTTERSAQHPSVRVDAGVRAGDVVSPNYDSLLAKVIAHAPRREEAAAVLARTLAGAALHGPDTNRDALVAILGESDFLDGTTFTRYLDDHPAVTAGADADGPLHPAVVARLAAAVVDAERRHRAGDHLWGFAPSGWRNLSTQGQRSRWTVSGRAEPVDVEYRVAGDGITYELAIGGEPHTARHRSPRSRRGSRHSTFSARIPTGAGGERAENEAGTAVQVEVDGIRTSVTLHHVGGVVWANSSAGQQRLEPLPRFVDHDAEMAAGGPVAPLPGTIVSVEVSDGDEVNDGDILIVLEAMKMEHRITAHGAGTVESVYVAPGDRVDAGQVLVRLAER